MQSQFRERHWDRLLVEIEESRVIPIIGPELLEVEVNGNTQLLYDYIANELIEEFDIDTDSLNLTQIAEFFNRNGDLHEMYYEINRILKKADIAVPDPLLKLAEISHFNLFVSISFDEFMLKALNQVRYKGSEKTISLNYSNRSELVDIPLFTEKQSIVYQLFGKVCITPEYVVTEEDLLQYIYKLQDKERQPVNLFDQLRSKKLLQLGCQFENWLERFFVCCVKSDSLFKDGVRGVVADKVAKEDSNLLKFFQRRKTNYYKGGSIDFVNELHKRWIERYGSMTVDNEPEVNDNSTTIPVSQGSDLSDSVDFKQDAIFISYASEDVESATNIRKALESKGLKVWMDKARLEAGDDYRLKIDRNIEECSFFIPLISKHTMTLERRFFRLEWRKAQEEANFRPEGFPFIQPVLIDDTDPQNELIPKYFRQFTHFQRFINGNPSEDFLRLTQKRMRELKRLQRA